MRVLRHRLPSHDCVFLVGTRVLKFANLRAIRVLERIRDDGPRTNVYDVCDARSLKSHFPSSRVTRCTNAFAPFSVEHARKNAHSGASTSHKTAAQQIILYSINTCIQKYVHHIYIIYAWQYSRHIICAHAN